MATSYLGEIVESTETTRIVPRTVNGRIYQVHYVNKSKLKEANFSLFGYVYKRKIYLRENLPKRVERALLRHEVYHVEDTHQWLGKYGKEIRANFHTATCDPVGFFVTLVYSLSTARLKTYWRLYVWPRNLN